MREASTARLEAVSEGSKPPVLRWEPEAPTTPGGAAAHLAVSSLTQVMNVLPQNAAPAACVFGRVRLQAVGEILPLTPCPDLDVDRFVL